MGIDAQTWVALGMSLAGGVLLIYWVVYTVILMRGGELKNPFQR